MEPNEGGYDPNEPDCTNGDFFCRLCLSSQNSESMWASHIAGKRHIKNVQKFPNGLPTRDYVHDEDSYERPPKRERFDDGYDLYDDYPKPRFDDDYYYNERPPVHLPPIIKRNIVIDYGHMKKLDDVALPPEINKIPAPAVAPPPVLPVTRPLLTDASVGFCTGADQLLSKSLEKQPEVKDDFFEKLNKREIAKELAKELSKAGVINSIKTVIDDDKSQRDSHQIPRRDSSSSSDSSSEHESPPHRSSRKNSPPHHSSRKDSPPHRNSRKDSPPHRSSRRGSPPPRNFRRNSPPPRNFRRNSSHSPPDTRRSSHRDSNRSSRDYHKDSHRDYNKRGRRTPDVFDILQKNKDKKKFKFDDEKELKEKKSSLKKSSAKSKSIIDDIDPDELTTDVLDTLLSAQLKSKNSGNSDEICKKKHCIDLNDPKIIAEKLESLSTMEFLKIIHKKLVNVDLKNPEELKLLLKVIAEAQVAVCKKLPPELQALVKGTLSTNDGANSELPSQNPNVSQKECVALATTSSKIVSNNPFSVVSSSSQTTTSVNNTPTTTSLQTSAPQFNPLVPPPIPSISLTLNKIFTKSFSNAGIPQNQTAHSSVSSVMNTTTTLTPATPIQQTTVASVNNPVPLQTLQPSAIHNHYNRIFSLYQNHPSVPPIVSPINQPSPLLTRFPPPPPPPPVSASQRSQLSQEVLATIAKIKAQQPVKPSKQESSGSRDSPPKTREEILQALKNLDVLQEEYKRKKLLKLRNENKSNTPDNPSSFIKR